MVKKVNNYKKRFKPKQHGKKTTPKVAVSRNSKAGNPTVKNSSIKSSTVNSKSHAKGAVRLPKKRYVARSESRRHLDERLQALYQRAMVIEQSLVKLEENRFYRTCIFGSARIKPETPAYGEVFNLARILAEAGIDVLTGGGPGLMEAANQGAMFGRRNGKKSKAMSYGISIELDFEPTPNSHLDIKRHHYRFSSRLDDFMRLSRSIVVTPGGIGTLLELFFTWQLIQVKHISSRPIVLLHSEFWKGIVDWMREIPTARGLISVPDFDCLKIADSPEDAAQIIIDDFAQFNRAKVKKV